jgi:prepilin-type processing-associated H-X9-DG protein
VLKLYNFSKVKRSSEIILAFDGSMSLLTNVGQYSKYSGNPYYRPRQSKPVADYIDGGNLNFKKPYLIADWANAAPRKPDTVLEFTPFDAGGGTVGLPNTDQLGTGPGNDRNLRFRHNRETLMNALFCDGHVSSFALSKRQLTTNPPRAGDVLCKNVFLDRP